MLKVFIHGCLSTFLRPRDEGSSSKDSWTPHEGPGSILDCRLYICFYSTVQHPTLQIKFLSIDYNTKVAAQWYMARSENPRTPKLHAQYLFGV